MAVAATCKMKLLVQIRNPQPVTITLRTVFVGLLLLAISACGGPQERKAQYRAKAQSYIQQGNFPKARVALRNVLKIDPNDAEAYLLVGRVEEKEKNWRNAVANYQQVVDIVPDHKEALITLGKYYLEARLTDEVMRVADKVLARIPQDPQAQALKIAVLAQQEELPRALVRAEELVRLHPTNPDVAILLATLYGQQKRLHEARTILQRALQTHPHHLDLLNNLKTVLDRAQDHKATELVLRQLIQEEPTLYDHRLTLARFYDQRQEIDQAESELRDAVQVFADNEQAWLALADFLNLRRGKDSAQTSLRQAAERLPYSTKIPAALAALYESHKDVIAARLVYEKMTKDYEEKPAGLDAQVKIAQLEFNAGHEAEAENLLMKVLRKNPRSTLGLILQGKLALRKRNGKDAVQAFRTVLLDQPELVHAQYLLGQAYLLTGHLQLARESFERAVALHPDMIEAGLALAVLETQGGQLLKAKVRLSGILKSHPNYPPALEHLFLWELKERNWNQAREILNRLRQVTGETSATMMAEGRMQEAQRDFANATVSFERAASITPNAQEPLVALIRLDLDQNHPYRARQRLEALVNSYPTHPYAHGILGEVLSIIGRRDTAVINFRTATRLNPTWITPWLNWATLLLTEGQPDSAIQTLRAGLAVNPASEELHLLLGSVLADQGSVDEAIASYDAVLRMNPHNIFSANNLAALLADFKTDASHLERAFLLSREFEKEAPHPLFLDTLGWVRLRMGHVEDALRIMRQAIVKAPDLPVLNYHLGAALYQSGRNVEAKGYLAKALKSTEQFQGRREAQQLLARTSG